MMDIFNRCVYQETGANVDFNLPDFVLDQRKLALRTAATAAAAVRTTTAAAASAAAASAAAASAAAAKRAADPQ